MVLSGLLFVLFWCLCVHVRCDCVLCGLWCDGVWLLLFFVCGFVFVCVNCVCVLAVICCVMLYVCL